ncbi:MAG: YihY/virulence factor BrkB family protein, partial [Proteobacteria bacterium]|nr:YihY/virulence factor BrkB family protein [Pseudomonadota bacterium]
VAHQTRDRRSFLKVTGIALLLTVGAIGVVVVAMAAMVATPVVLRLADVGGLAKPAVEWGRWIVLLVMIVVGIGVLYRLGPDRTTAPRWRWVSPGGITAAVLWLVASGLFSWYVANFGTFNKTYGSLGAVIGFMIWMWLSTIIVLLGAELDAVLEARAKGLQR